jgi:hypothetical protein
MQAWAREGNFPMWKPAMKVAITICTATWPAYAIVAETIVQDQVEKKQMNICSGNEDLVGRVIVFARRIGIVDKQNEMSNLLTLLCDVASTASGSHPYSQSDAKLEVVADANICCWSTGKLYTEALLGVGVSREKRNITTAAELRDSCASRQEFINAYANEN